MTSSEVWPELREYERAMTTVMCAYVGPVMAGYLSGLETQLDELGIAGPLEIMDSAGGVMSAAMAARRPVRTLESGGAAGVTAAGLVGQLIGAPAVISFDMGGTTAKVGIVRDGRPGGHQRLPGGRQGQLRRHPRRHGVPREDPHRRPRRGRRRRRQHRLGRPRWRAAGRAAVGGRRARTRCYGRGGTEPTVTDANLLLGYLDPAGLAGGVTLSVDAASRAVTRAVAEPLGIDVIAAARGIHDIVNANMAAAIRVVTVQRGIDPRDFTLVAFGGAGPMHAVRLAQMFGIRSVAVPFAAGVASAVGLVGADLGVELVQTRIVDLADADAAELEAAFGELTAQARAELAEEPGATFIVTRSADVRYRGQAYHLTVPVPIRRSTPTTSPRSRRASATLRDRTASRSTTPRRSTTCACTCRVVDKLTPRARTLADGDAAAAAPASAWSCSRRPARTRSRRRSTIAPLLVPGDQLEGPR